MNAREGMDQKLLEQSDLACCGERDTPSRFRIVSWNIERGKKFTHILRTMHEKIDADIYALQEVDRYAHRTQYRDVCADLARSLDMSFVYGAEFREFAQEGYKSEHAFYGQGFLTHLQLLDSRAFYLPHQIYGRSLQWFHKPLISSKVLRLPIWYRLVQNRYIYSQRFTYRIEGLVAPRSGGQVALIGKFRIGAKKVFVYNIHLEGFGNDKQKAIQMQDILHDVRTRTQENDAVVILGDLNTQCGESSLVIQAAYEDGFRDALLHFEDQKIATCKTNQRLDWILTKNLKTISASVLKDSYDASDHRPVIAELEFLS